MGVALVTLRVMNTCQRKLRYCGTDYTEGLPASRRVSIIKVSGRMRSDAFKRRLGFSFTVIILPTLYYC